VKRGKIPQDCTKIDKRHTKTRENTRGHTARLYTTTLIYIIGIVNTRPAYKRRVEKKEEREEGEGMRHNLIQARRANRGTVPIPTAAV